MTKDTEIHCKATFKRGVSMRWFNRIQLGLVALASIGVMFPQLAMANGPQSTQQTRDMSLRSDGSFVGKVLNQHGRAQDKQPVLLLQNGQPIATALTNANGEFGFQLQKGGLYQIQSRDTVTTYRMWTAATAPPSAVQSATLVTNDTLVLGQNCAHCGVSGCGGGCVGHPGGGGGAGVLGFLANPWVLGGLVAAAIAIPLALDDDDAS